METTGDGLNIIISCDYIKSHSWMAFVTWYSLYKNLPDAKVFILSNRGISREQLFSWTKQTHTPLLFNSSATIQEQINFILTSKIQSPLLILKPTVMAIRELNLNWIEQLKSNGHCSELCHIGKISEEIDELSEVNSSKSDISEIFVSYRDGCGKFVLSDWINKSYGPLLAGVSQFKTDSMTLNESKIFELWTHAAKMFKIIS